ncbi:MAG: tRNA (adenosine(37)-N6)-threonylcarbamoyltransferase complex dimerization subunit type 1 TsaB [Anaerofustis sp.]
MLILAIDTSTISASVAVIDENKLHGEIYTDYKLKHSEKLLPLVDHLLRDIHMTIKEMDAFAVTCGPGSFTGLRIGAATAKAFSHACAKPIIGVSTLESCAFLQSGFGGMICPVLDAQQSSVYTALFKYRTDGIQRLTEDAVLPLNDLIRKIPDQGDILFCGDAADKFRQELSFSLGDRAVFANSLTKMPRASAAGALAVERLKHGEVSDYRTFTPNYIRASQAEVNYEIKVK